MFLILPVNRDNSFALNHQIVDSNDFRNKIQLNLLYVKRNRIEEEIKQCVYCSFESYRWKSITYQPIHVELFTLLQRVRVRVCECTLYKMFVCISLLCECNIIIHETKWEGNSICWVVVEWHALRTRRHYALTESFDVHIVEMKLNSFKWFR